MSLAPKRPASRESVEYLVPARRISGTRAEVLAALDELIQGLIGARHLVSLQRQEQPSDIRVRSRAPEAPTL